MSASGFDRPGSDASDIKPRRTLPHRRWPAVPPNPKSQVERVFAKFGGVPRLHAALKRLSDPKKHRTRPQLYRWNYPRSQGGCGGVIPSPALKDILEAARWEGIVITPEDLYGGTE